MNQTEFQYESGGVTVSLRTPEPHQSFTRLESFQAGIESAILGLRLRGFLSDSEKDLLDCLAPPNHLCFMLRGEEYLHPAGCQLFEEETFKPTQSAHNSAFFQRRYESCQRPTSGTQTVYSAQINPYGDKSLTMGILGPEDPTTSARIKDRFGGMIEMARQAWRRSDTVIEKLNDKLASDDPLLLINRCSGRIIHLNPAARRLFEAHGEELVDQEFSIIKSALAESVTGHRLSITNHLIDDFFLATLQLSKLKREAKLPKSEIIENIIHKMRNKISAVTAASSYLKAMQSSVSKAESTELSGIILNESNDIESFLRSLQLVANYDNTELSSTLLGEDLVSAINQANSDSLSKPKVIFESAVDEIKMRYPQSAVTTLLMSALYGFDERGLVVGDIEITCTPTQSRVCMTSKPWSETPSVPKEWEQCTVHISDLMKVNYQTALHSESQTLKTTLEFDNE